MGELMCQPKRDSVSLRLLIKQVKALYWPNKQQKACQGYMAKCLLTGDHSSMLAQQACLRHVAEGRRLKAAATHMCKAAGIKPVICNTVRRSSWLST